LPGLAAGNAEAQEIALKTPSKVVTGLLYSRFVPNHPTLSGIMSTSPACRMGQWPPIMRLGFAAPITPDNI
jgi:hypothetical protein